MFLVLVISSNGLDLGSKPLLIISISLWRCEDVDQC